MNTAIINKSEENIRSDDVNRRIIKADDRIAIMARSLLLAAGINKEEKATLCIDEIFSDTLPLVSAQIRRENIELKVVIPEAVKVRVNLRQIQQVLLNIISNARFALNKKYPETHENKIVEVTCEELKIDNSPFVRIIFTDRGIGIPSNIIDKVITPFFSTKPSCLGPGLGLSISHGIITEHGGKLLISSVEGEYTRIAIDLPIAAE